MRRLIKRIAAKHERMHFCYEAGPTGYGLYRLITMLGYACTVAAPSLIPRKPGNRVKTNRRDAMALAKLLRAGELTPVWVPDETHEAMRDLVRARADAVETQRVHRQQVSGFMLKHGRVFPRTKADPATDWSKVNINALRQHLIDMDNVTLRADVKSERVDGGARFTVSGAGPVKDSIQRAWSWRTPRT